VPSIPGASDLDLTPGTQFYAGGSSESINPTKAMIDTNHFYLGGFGFGSGRTIINQLNDNIPQYDSGRVATGSMPGAYGASSRAMALADGKHAIVTAQIETQGYFLAYKNGNYGIVDIRRQAAAQVAALQTANNTKGVNDLPARAIVIDSDHSHSGPDTAGVWGGVPTAGGPTGADQSATVPPDLDYLKLVKDRTVKAIVDAWTSLQPVDLFYGTRPVGVNGAAYTYPNEPGIDRLMNNQYDDDPSNQVVDDELRVIQARKPGTNVPVMTYVNFSAHPDVLGSGNKLVSGDYIGPLSEMLAENGGVGFAQVATLGREQPSRGGDCAPADLIAPGEPNDQCRLRQYAARVNKRAQEAIALAQPVTGPKVVALSSYFLTDVASNALIMGLDYGGFAPGVPLMRAQTPPWETGNVMGTTMFSGRIGNLVISGNPGEPYPQILQRVRDGVPGKQGYLSLGTAGDFLGYIIYPFGAYPEPIRRSILSGGPPPNSSDTCADTPGGQAPSPAPTAAALPSEPVTSPAGCPNPIGNDNFFFNVSLTLGQRLVCAELRGVKENFPTDTIDVNTIEPQCAAFTQDGALPGGWETQFSSTGIGASDEPGSNVPEAPYTVLLLLAGLAVGGVAVARRRAA
jgi:lysozyme family protein